MGTSERARVRGRSPLLTEVIPLQLRAPVQSLRRARLRFSRSLNSRGPRRAHSSVVLRVVAFRFDDLRQDGGRVLDGLAHEVPRQRQGRATKPG